MRIDRTYLALTLLYLAFLITIVVFANARVATWVFASVRLIPLGDKVCHMILMGLFAFFLNSTLCCHRTAVFGGRVLTGSLIVILLVAAEELSQHWVVTRSADLWDLAFDLIGIQLFGWCAAWNWRQKQQPACSRLN